MRSSKLAGIELLERAVEQLLVEDPAGMRPQVAMDRAGRLLAAQERLVAASGLAVADVDVRELFALVHASSTRGWLRTQTCGDHGQLAASRRLRSWPAVRTALADGRVGRAGADQLCAALGRVEAGGEVQDDQLLGVLGNGVAVLLTDWVGGALDDDLLTEEHLDRRERAGQVLTYCVELVGAPADRLAPALVLLAEALPASQLPAALGQLVDALQPERLDEDSDADLAARPSWLGLRPVEGGFQPVGFLRTEDGIRLLDALRARTRKAARDEAARRARQAAVGAVGADDDLDGADLDGAEVPGESPGGPAAAWPDLHDADPHDADPHDADPHDPAMSPLDPEPPEDVDLFGRAGPGRPQLPPAPCTLESGTPAHPVEGPVPLAPGEDLGLALLQLIHDAGLAPVGSGTPSPAQLTVVVSADSLYGAPGALPGQLDTPRGPVTLGPEAIQRLGCSATWAAVLLDGGVPVGGTGTHRNATRAERRALRAQWGATCAVNGCTRPGEVPHHAELWWRTLHTRLADLVPICRTHHHDVHEGHRTLRLRDGRLIGPDGWAREHDAAA